MFYRVLRRILRRHALFHLLIPLVIGAIVEVLWAHFMDRAAWSSVPDLLLSGSRIALYLGIFGAYVIVTGILITSETNIGMRRIDLNSLAAKLDGTKSLFVVSTTPFQEWFDPAAQVYLAVIYSARLAQANPFRYERVLLLPHKSSEDNLNSEYLDGYHARCLIDIHRRLGIELYFLEWTDIEGAINALSPNERILIGYYPSSLRHFPEWLIRTLVWPARRRRIRRIAGGVIEGANSGAPSAFRFAKRENVVDVRPHPQERADAYIKFVGKLKDRIYQPSSTVVDPLHNFLEYFHLAEKNKE
jgi:hypothetical protein